jgi:hypothetical protein
MSEAEVFEYPNGRLISEEDRAAFLRRIEKNQIGLLRKSLMDVHQRVSDGRTLSVVIIELGPTTHKATAHVAPWVSLGDVKSLLAEQLPSLLPDVP